MTVNAAILFEPEAYVLDGPKLMGRQAAGNAYLRAAVAGRGGEALSAYSPRRQSGEVFSQLVKSIDPGAKGQWIPANRLDLLTKAGTLYLPGPVFRDAAMLRLRAGPAAYSLTGVTHTTASHTAMDAIASMALVPVMPWDALICTSQAVLSTVKVILAAEHEYLAWRYGHPVRPSLPQLPVIPLGVHVADFQSTLEQRRAARTALGVRDDEVVALFVGRLSFHAKAHPYQMYLGLEEAAKRTGKRVALIQCGWFANQMIEKAFKAGAAKYAPSVRAIFTDGREAAARDKSWAASDIFVSLSDNIQETFGLAPVEAMAAGMPVVATDWNGYKDTIRNGLDGFLVPTTMPPPDLGAPMAALHESEELNYDQYCGVVCRTVSVDVAALADRLAELIKSPDLRQKLGASGRARAIAEYDWSIIYRKYQSLWAELGRMRAAAKSDASHSKMIAAAPKAAASRLDPMLAFGHYPTRLIGADDKVTVMQGASRARFEELTCDNLFSYMPEALPPADLVASIIDGASTAPTPRALAETCKTDLGRMILTLSILSKMGLVRLVAGGGLEPPTCGL